MKQHCCTCTFTYQVKTRLWCCRVWFNPQVLPPHIGTNQESSSAHRSECFSYIPSHKSTCLSERNASRPETEKTFLRLLPNIKLKRPIRSVAASFTRSLINFSKSHMIWIFSVHLVFELVTNYMT